MDRRKDMIAKYDQAFGGFAKEDKILAGMDEFIVDDPTVPGGAQFEKNISGREGEVIWSYYR